MPTGMVRRVSERKLKAVPYPATTMMDGKIRVKPCEDLKAGVANTSETIAIAS
jgi:hypothetical protein